MAKSAANAIDPSTMRIVVLHGSERFLIEERTRSLTEALEQRFGGVQQFAFDGASVEPAVLLDELRSYGLMQRHKLVILDNADQFLSGKKSATGGDEGDEDEAGAAADGESEGKSSRRPIMERYAESPVEDATLLMRATTWRAGKLDKLILKRGAIIECEPPNENSAAGWCQKRCEKRYDATIDRDAAELLVHRVGSHLQRLDTELLKLASMLGKGGRITRQIVADNTSPSSEEKAWEIQAAIASGSAGQMLGKLSELLNVSRQDWVPISWAAIDLLRKQHAAARLLEQGVSEQAIPRQVKLWGDSISAVMRTARRAEPDRLAQLLRDAVQSDFHSKSETGEAVRNLETLMVRIADTTGAN
jgi:DNA polymerase III delta subunit